MMYELPMPINTSAVLLPPAWEARLEGLAENVHAHWCVARLRDGWRYGPHRDDVSKQHPCLVPYSELPEEEKNYDRLIVRETMKALLL